MGSRRLRASTSRSPRVRSTRFLGPNGAGKTTTVRMLTTLLRPTGGSARVAGYDVVEQAADVRRSIGVALQEAALDPLMTGRELIRLQATLHGLIGAEAARRGDALIDRVGLSKAADRRVGTYSGGMRRRLDLASALVHEPRVLFLDEPTTGLDPVSRKAIWEEVVALNARGHDRLPHDAVPRGGRPTRRPGRDHQRRPPGRRGHPGVAEGRRRQAAPRAGHPGRRGRAGEGGGRAVRRLAARARRQGPRRARGRGQRRRQGRPRARRGGDHVRVAGAGRADPRRRFRRQDRRAPRGRRSADAAPEAP